jgi:glutamate synthase (NADPH/NADH) small chain
MQLRIESSHEEGGVRDWSVNTVKFTGDENGNVRQLHAVRVTPRFEPLPGTEFTLDADLVLLAMGFTGPVKNGMIDQLGVALDARGNVAADADYMSSVPGVFAAGDMRRGQSLVVWAIAEGRKAAEGIDRYLRGVRRLVGRTPWSAADAPVGLLFRENSVMPGELSWHDVLPAATSAPL